MTNQPPVLRARRAFVALFAALLATLGWSSSVSAHTEFAGSAPVDGATVVGPLSTVTVEFTNPAVESGDGFALLEPDGTVRTPESVDATDGTAFVVTFDPPLDPGTYGFRWEVQAGDAHPIQGSFQFTVQGSAPASTAATIPEVATSSPAIAAPESTPSTTVPVDHSTMSMDEFLADDNAPDPLAGRVARTVTMSSTVFAVGVLAALAWIIRGRRDEIDRLLVWVRLAGLGLVTGGVAAFAALDEVHPVPLSDTATSRPGVAALLAVAGGALVYVGFGRRAGAIAAPRSLSSAVATDEVVARRSDRVGMQDADAGSDQFRWAPDRSAAVGMVGIALALGAYSFDGHTVSRGPWPVHAAVDLVHVTAASVWVGGVFAMTLVAWMRKRRRADTDLAPMVVRFSTIAGVSLAALSVAGFVMAWFVLDSPGDLFSTDWGQVLLVKMGAVAIAAGVGGYNHFRLRPALEARPDDPAIAAQIRVSLSIESLVMIAVIVITAVLVASST